MIGKKITRVDALEKVLGQAIYSADLSFSHLLWAKILRSPYPHARIVDVDASRARKHSGVKALITGKDLTADANYGPYIADQSIVARDIVRYPGEPVAAVAAMDKESAEEALELIRVEYEELPPVLDPERALEPDAGLVHPDLGNYRRYAAVQAVAGTNICNIFKIRSGDVDKGLASAYRVYSDRFSAHRVHHCPLEVHHAIAQVDGRGKVTIWASNQGPFAMRRIIADSLGLAYNQVRVIVPLVGGGFGSKNYPTVEPIAVALARETHGRPVRLEVTREEEFCATTTKLPCNIDIDTGVSKEGIILARKVRMVWDTGAYGTAGPVVAVNAGCAAAGPYRITDVWIDSYCVYTNNPVGGAFRGFGIPAVAWAYESQMDIIAEDLGLDPIEIRMRNAFEAGDISPTGERLVSVGLKDSLHQVSRRLTVSADKGKSANKARGKGVACMFKSSHVPSSSSATLKINEDGSAQLVVAAVEMGQGLKTILTQIVGEVLGLGPDDIMVTDADTDICPYDWATVASRATFFAGNAAKVAAEDARNKLAAVAAEKLEAEPRDLKFEAGRIFVTGSPDKGISLADTAYYGHYLKGGPIIGTGTCVVEDATFLDPDTGQGARPGAFWMYATQVAELEVDLETGHVQVTRLVAAHDVGRAINPWLCEQQIQGALVMGLSTTLNEELVLDNGRPVNASFSDYSVIGSTGVPMLEPIIVEAPQPDGPFGAKGLGEPGLAPTAAAIANALYDAIGVRIKDLPITPEKVLRAIRAKKSDGERDR
jgi:carbon-monoxide dehydrogenase large subunit